MCAGDPALADWMARSEPMMGDRLPSELRPFGEAALRRFAYDVRSHYAAAEQHQAGTHPHDYKFSEAAREELAENATWMAEDARDEGDRLALALGYEVLPPPAAPRWQAADGRKVYL